MSIRILIALLALALPLAAAPAHACETVTVDQYPDINYVTECAHEQSTYAGASGWVTVQDIASFGAGAYYVNEGSGADCTESYELDLDLGGLVFVPLTTGPGACTTELPWIYDTLP